MQRRVFVAFAITTVVGAVSGCIGDTTQSRESTITSSEKPPTPKRSTSDNSGTASPTITLEPTPQAMVVPFEDLSPKAQREVRIAIEEGSYQTNDYLALNREVNYKSRIEYRGQLYSPLVAVGDCATDTKSTCDSIYVLEMISVQEDGSKATTSSTVTSKQTST